MQIGVVGVGTMSSSRVRRLPQARHVRFFHDVHPARVPITENSDPKSVGTVDCWRNP